MTPSMRTLELGSSLVIDLRRRNIYMLAVWTLSVCISWCRLQAWMSCFRFRVSDTIIEAPAMKRPERPMNVRFEVESSDPDK